MAQVPHIFDRHALGVRRARAAKNFTAHDFLISESADRLLDRLNDMMRGFKKILVIGGHYGLMRKKLELMGYDRDAVTVIDLVAEAGADILADEELLPFPAACFDCVISHLTLPFVNDVPGVLAQIRYSLKPDGLFLGSTLGVNTLVNVQDAMMRADIELHSGAGTRIGPFIDIVDAAALMQRTGFGLPVIDQEPITVQYKTLEKLMHDLRGMGWSSPQAGRGKVKTSKAFFDWTEKNLNLKKQGFEAYFEVLTLTGWAPSDLQQKPLARGSAENRLADALESKEYPV